MPNLMPHAHSYKYKNSENIYIYISHSDRRNGVQVQYRPSQQEKWHPNELCAIKKWPC
jgi:hypothetical protein